MKKQKKTSPAAAQAESAPAPQVSETTAQLDPANREAAPLTIPPEIVNNNERRAYALAYRRTMAGRKLDFMPGSMIAVLCRGIAAAVFTMQEIGREIETATRAADRGEIDERGEVLTADDFETPAEMPF